MIFVQLLVFTCACALTAADVVTSYKDIYEEILQAYRTLDDNVLSMDGNIPLLNDSRRHYAEIIHVLHSEAQSENSVFKKKYYKNYQQNINESAPFAIANPQSVVDGTNKVISDIEHSIFEVIQLVNAKDSDKAVDEEIKKNIEKYEFNVKVYFATGVVAGLLNANDKDYFAASSQNLSAHNFVITGAPILEEIVMALKYLYQLLSEL